MRAQPPRPRAPPHRRGHDRADPPPRRPPPRPARSPRSSTRQGRRTGTGLPFTEAARRAPSARRAGIPAAPPPDPDSETGHDRAGRRPSSASSTPRSAAGCATACCPASRPRPHAPWRIRLTDEIRARFVPDIPDGYRRARRGRHARSAAPARPCCTRSNAASCTPIHVTRGRRKGLAIKVPAPDLDRLINSLTQEVQCEPGPGGPSRTTFSRACRKSSWPRCSITGLLDASAGR